MSDFISIPLKDSNSEEEVLLISKNELPSVDDMCKVLIMENCNIKTWMSVALEYIKKNKNIDSLKLLHKALEIIPNNNNMGNSDVLHVLDLMGAFCTQQAFHQETTVGREQYVKAATEYFTIGDQISIVDEYHLLLRAFLNLLNSPETSTHFNIILEHSPSNILALLGKAWMEYNNKQYENALKYYTQVLLLHPACPTGVHIAVAYCFSNLNLIGKAKRSFKLVLNLYPNNVRALIGLALLKFKSNDQDISLPPPICLELLTKAYRIESNNPVVLNHMCNFRFWNKNYNNFESFCNQALQHSEKNSVRSQSYYNLARYYHARADYNQAFEYYFKSSQIADSRFYLPLYGLGQMYIKRNDFENAQQCFETVLQLEPKSYDCMKVLGSIYASSKCQETRKRACELLKKVIDALPNEYESLVEYAQLLEEIDIKKSLQTYKTACEIMNELDIDVPPEVLNNMAVISYRMQNYDSVHNYLELAILANQKMRLKNTDYYDSIAVTMKYNFARAKEILQKVNEADQLYKEVLKEHPNYVDCYMRLGCIARDKGQIFVASDFFKDVLNVDKNHGDARCLLGNLHMTKNQLLLAQKHFESILKQPNTTEDSYALIALGNIALQAAQQMPADREKTQKYLTRALTFYEKVLLKEPANIWATTGIASVIAHQGFVKEALEVFTTAQDSTAFDTSEMTLNMGHCLFEMKKFNFAIKKYDLCSRKFFKNKNVEVLHSLAHAYYMDNRFKDALRTFKIARHLAPNDTLLLYNMAVVLKMIARVTFGSDSTINQISSATHGLSLAIEYFEYLIKIKPAHISTSQCEAEISSCKDIYLQTKSNSTIHLSATDFDNVSRISKLIMRCQDEKQRKMKQEQLHLAKMENQMRIKNEAKRQRYLVKAQKVLELVKAPPEKPKRHQNQTDIAHSAVDFLLSGSAPSKPTKRLRKPRQPKTENTKTKKTRQAKQRPKVISKAFISSSESESTDMEEPPKRTKLNILYSSSPVDDFQPSETTFETDDEEDFEIEQVPHSFTNMCSCDTELEIIKTVPVRQPFTPIDFSNRRPSKFRPISTVYKPWAATTIKNQSLVIKTELKPKQEY